MKLPTIALAVVFAAAMPAGQRPDSPAGDDDGATVATPAAAQHTQGPKLIAKAPLEYPEAARRAHVTGAVQVEMRIGTEGQVLAAHAVDGPFLLRVPAEAAVLKWRYLPATEGGRPVESKARVKLDFQQKM